MPGKMPKMDPKASIMASDLTTSDQQTGKGEGVSVPTVTPPPTSAGLAGVLKSDRGGGQTAG